MSVSLQLAVVVVMMTIITSNKRLKFLFVLQPIVQVVKHAHTHTHILHTFILADTHSQLFAILQFHFHECILNPM